jgi:flagellar protein FliL
LKKLIPFVLVAVVFGGAGMGAASLLKKPAAPAHGEEPEKKDGEKSAEKAIVTLEDFIVNLADTSEQRYLKSTVALEMTGAPVGEEEMKKISPELRDAVLTVMSRRTMRDLQAPNGKQSLKDDIKKEINRVMGEKRVVAVYFTAFAMQ